MIKIILNRLASDCKTFFYGFLVSLILFAILGLWRIFDTDMFIFIQIVLATILLYLVSLIAPFMRPLQRVVGREFLIILIAFTITSTLLLNIDRSRSVFLVKWVYENSKEAPIPIEDLIKLKNLSTTEGLSIAQRVGEQGQMVFIKEGGSGLEVTLAGRIFIQMSSFISKLLNLKGYQSA